MKGVSKDILRLAKPLPLVGQAAALASARQTLNEKGATLGGLDLALDLVPIVGRMKGLFELFGGELLSEKNLRNGFSTIRRAVDQLEAIVEEEVAKVSGGEAPRKDPETEGARNQTPGEGNERHYPENSAKLAMMRARAATKPVYETRPTDIATDNEALQGVDA